MARLVRDWCRHFPTGVPDDGSHSCDAKLVLIGEAPGRAEDEQGLPFVGPSGFKLSEWWSEVGLSREQFYITNVVTKRPPNNEIYAVGRDELHNSISRLHGRLARLSSPYVIVPTGDVALNALMGNSYGERKRITDWRGSILDSAYGKVIPTIHPAA